MEEIDISGNEGVYLVFRNRNRLTWYNTLGSMRVQVNESTTLLEFQANTKTRLSGFTVFQEFSPDPFIGGFEDQQQPQPPQPPLDGFWLHVLPCADELSDVWLASEELTVPDDTKVEFQLLLFSLTYVESLVRQNLATCTYTISDLTGKEWVRMTQTRGAASTELGGTCGNNHPQKRYIPGLAYDCCVYLPKQTYIVKMTNTSTKANIQGWVHHPHEWPGEAPRNIFKGRLVPDQTVVVTIDVTEFLDHSYRNAIKINGNAVYEVNT